MARYEYHCEKCGENFELNQKMSDPNLKFHTIEAEKGSDCGGPVTRLVGAPLLKFKGSGFYLTDYGKGTR